MIFSIPNIVSLVVLSMIFMLGIFSFFQDRKNLINRLFGLMSLSGALWIFTNFIVDVSYAKEHALVWTKATIIGPALFFALFVYFTIVFKHDEEENFQLKPYLKFIIFLPSLLFIALVGTDWNIKDILMNVGAPPLPILGPLYYFFILYIVSYSTIGTYNLIDKYRNSPHIGKLQTSYILVGSLSSIIWGIFLSVIFPIFGYSEAAGFGPLGISFFLAFSSFAILEYHLLNVKIVATEIFIIIIWIILLTRIFISNTYRDLSINIVVFSSVLIVGVLLIKSVIKEVKQRERIEKMAQEIKEAYEIEKKAKEELERLADIKNQFLMTIQHHLRTPLTSMRGYSDLLLSGAFGKVPPKIEEVIKRFEGSTTSLIKMVNDFLDVTQFQLGKQVINPKDGVNLSPMLEEIVNDIKLEADKKGVELKLEKPDTECIIKADESKLKAALVNIFDNSVKYTEKGSVTMTLKEDPDKVKIEIKDTGMGISKERLPKLFDTIFERTDAAKKSFTTGRGIGLYLSSNIIKSHNGKIWAESEGEGKGSTFHIEIPKN